MRSPRLFAFILFAICLAASGGTAAQARQLRLHNVAAEDLAALQKIVRASPQRYAGVAVDPETGAVRVYVRRSEQKTAEKEMARFEVMLAPVVRSQADLESVFAQITTRQPWASIVRDRISAWYINPRTNKVTVGLTSVTEAARASAKASFGDTVEVVPMERHQSMTGQAVVPTGKIRVMTTAPYATRRAPEPATAVDPTRLLDAPPYYGGDRIIRWRDDPDGTTTIWWCTASFTVTSGSTRLMSTAGHCGPTGTAWQQGYYDSGSGRINTTGSMGTERSVQWGDNRMDAATIGGGSYWLGAVYGGQLEGSAWGIDGQQAATVGSSVCADGSVTRENCSARISAINACVNLNDNGTIVKVCNQALADSTSGVISQHGDSGGPVLRHTNDPNRVVAVGIISGGSSNGLHMNFTQIQNFTSTFGVTVATGSP